MEETIAQLRDRLAAKTQELNDQLAAKHQELVDYKRITEVIKSERGMMDERVASLESKVQEGLLRERELQATVQKQNYDCEDLKERQRLHQRVVDTIESGFSRHQQQAHDRDHRQQKHLTKIFDDLEETHGRLRDQKHNNLVMQVDVKAVRAKIRKDRKTIEELKSNHSEALLRIWHSLHHHQHRENPPSPSS